MNENLPLPLSLDSPLLNPIEFLEHPRILQIKTRVAQNTSLETEVFDQVMLLIHSVTIELFTAPTTDPQLKACIQAKYNQTIDQLLQSHPWLDESLGDKGRVLNIITATIKGKDPGKDPTYRGTGWMS